MQGAARKRAIVRTSFFGTYTLKFREVFAQVGGHFEDLVFKK
jgi:hypothetical protein